jgi:hypothetical protein
LMYGSLKNRFIPSSGSKQQTAATKSTKLFTR